MSEGIIKKFLNPTLHVMGELMYSENFKANGGAEFLNERDVVLQKNKKGFNISFRLLADERRYINDVLDTRLQEYTITSLNEVKYIIPLKSTLLTSLKDVNDNLEYDVSGSISQICTTPLKDFEDLYHRIVIPVDVTRFSFMDFQHLRYETDIPLQNRELINISIHEKKFQLYTFKKENHIYWAVDSNEPLKLRDFQEHAFSIFNAYGFIEGELHLDEAFYISSIEKDFIEGINMFYTSIRDSLITGYNIFTRNPYSVFVPLYKNQGLPIDRNYVDKWYDKIGVFKDYCFSKLATLFHDYDSISRAALIVLEANSQPLELKAASYCVAFEGICHTIKKEFGINSPNVIDNTLWTNQIKNKFSDLIQSLKIENTINEDQERILTNKLNNWNQPINKDSLTAPFVKYGYELNKDELKCIGDRNRFLHGSLPVNEKNEDEAFKELYHISLTIHKLIYVLVLKTAEFEGYIINYPKLHNHITEREIGSDLLVKI